MSTKKYNLCPIGEIVANTIYNPNSCCNKLLNCAQLRHIILKDSKCTRVKIRYSISEKGVIRIVHYIPKDMFLTVRVCRLPPLPLNT